MNEKHSFHWGYGIFTIQCKYTVRLVHVHTERSVYMCLCSLSKTLNSADTEADAVEHTETFN